MPPTPTSTAVPAIPSLVFVTSAVGSSRTHSSTRGRARHAAPRIVSRCGSCRRAGPRRPPRRRRSGFATHLGFGATRSVIPLTHATTSGTATTIGPACGPPIELVTADIASAGHPTCVCSSPYVGAVTGPPIVENEALARLVASVWRSGAETGDGSTFRCGRIRGDNGQLVGGTTHFQKLAEAWQNLTRLMKTRISMSPIGR